MKQSDRTLMQYKREILSKVSLVMFLLILPMGIFRIYEGNAMQAASDIVLSIFLLYISFKSKSIEERAFFSLARKVFLLAFITLFILMIHTHETMMLFIWFITAIYLLFYIFDNKEGWRWFIGVTSVTVILFFYDSSILGLRGYELLVLVFNMFTVLLIITWYEKIKIASARNLLENQHLLELKVQEKTQALNALNESLEQRVVEEVEKNRLKEKQLIRQSRLAQMGEIISMIAHQWRQPLSAVSASSALLEFQAKQDKLDAETVQKKAREISRLSQHLSKTIDDFRDFFRPHKEASQTSYDEIIDSVQSMIDTSLSDKHIQVYRELACHDSFTTYANKVKQVVLNLIKNSEDALLEKEIKDPYVKIRTYRSNDRCILEISDNAGGIPEALMEKIYDPYFSTKDEKNGTGLGLYMSKVIIENHCNGELKIENGEAGAVCSIVLYGSI
jgi:signal transduction histidine kinase